MRYRAEQGLFPRGYAGGRGSLTEIELVLCIAEPGEPAAGARPLPAVEPRALTALLAASVEQALRVPASAFHSNVRFLLDCCWPDLPFEAQMRRTWITEGVLCSAARTTGRVPAAVERECASRYLAKQLALLPDAFVIALGRKAERRLKLAGRIPDDTVIAAGRPAANSKQARSSWRRAGAAFRRHLQGAKRSRDGQAEARG